MVGWKPTLRMGRGSGIGSATVRGRGLGGASGGAEHQLDVVQHLADHHIIGVASGDVQQEAVTGAFAADGQAEAGPRQAFGVVGGGRAALGYQGFGLLQDRREGLPLGGGGFGVGLLQSGGDQVVPAEAQGVGYADQAVLAEGLGVSGSISWSARASTTSATERRRARFWRLAWG